MVPTTTAAERRTRPLASAVDRAGVSAPRPRATGRVWMPLLAAAAAAWLGACTTAVGAGGDEGRTLVPKWHEPGAGCCMPPSVLPLEHLTAGRALGETVAAAHG